MLIAILPLATYYQPSLNPVGRPSFIALIAVIVLAALASWPTPVSIRWRIVRIAPAVLFFACLVDPGSSFSLTGSRFVIGSNIAAGVIYLSFGFGFALSNLRGAGNIGNRPYGALFIVLFGLLGIFHASLALSYLLFGNINYGIVVTGLCIVGALTYCLPKAQQYIIRQQRRRLNLCIACGYDLRGSIDSATCPECGEAIKQQITDR